MPLIDRLEPAGTATSTTSIDPPVTARPRRVRAGVACHARLAVAYVRVSTEEQSTSGLGLADQRERIAAYCMTDVVQTFLLFLRFRLVEGSLTEDGYLESAALAREALPGLFARRLTAAERTVLDAFLARCAPFFAEPRGRLRAV